MAEDNQGVKYYRKMAIQPMRPYIPGEDLTGVSVSAEDTPELGGMIAVGADNNARWYVSKKFFEGNYKEVGSENGMTFGQAIEAMRKGHKVQRVGWNGKDMFAYLVEGTNIGKGDYLCNAASAVSLREDLTAGPICSHQEICGHIDMMAADGVIVVGWLASQADMLADDWQIV